MTPLPVGTGKDPGNQHHTTLLLGVWKSKETSVLGNAGKTWKCTPWGLTPDNKNPPVICRVLLHCIGHSAAEEKNELEEEKSSGWKDLSNKERQGQMFFLLIASFSL